MILPSFFLKPVISVGHGPVKEGFEAWHIPHPAWEMQILDDLGKHFSDISESEILSAVPLLIQNKKAIAVKIENIRSEFVVNFGKASEPVASALIDIVDSVKGKK